MTRELGLNVDMVDVDFLRRVSDGPLWAVHRLQLRQLADNLAKEVTDVGILRAIARERATPPPPPPVASRDSYRVTYGPAMDHADFPYTVTGFYNAIDFAADKPGATICNPNRVDLDDPTGFTPQERAMEESLR